MKGRPKNISGSLLLTGALLALTACRILDSSRETMGAPSPTDVSLALPIVGGGTTPDPAIPPWVGTPAAGNPPGSDQPLPDGLADGDLVYGDGLLWFLWEGTKSRVWFPGTPPDDYSLKPEVLPQLAGALEPRPEAGMVTVSMDGQTGQVSGVYWADPVEKVYYLLPFRLATSETLSQIPTAYGVQYYAILASLETAPPGS